MTDMIRNERGAVTACCNLYYYYILSYVTGFEKIRIYNFSFSMVVALSQTKRAISKAKRAIS